MTTPQGLRKEPRRATGSPCRPGISRSICWRTSGPAARRSPRRSASADLCARISPPISARPTAAGWHAFGERLGKIGERYRKAGFDFGWHNHDFEFKALSPTASCRTTQIFGAAPDLGWEIDVAWVIRGGADPLNGSRNTASASRRCMSRTLHPPAKTPTRTAGPTSATAPSTGAALMQALGETRPRSTSWSTTIRATSRASPALDRSREAALRGIHGKELGVGIIGCGNISAAYFGLAPLFKGIEMRACADIDMDAARRAPRSSASRRRPSTSCSPTRHRHRRQSDDTCGALRGLEASARAGKHVYSEKPFVLSLKEGLDCGASPKRKACASAPRPTPSSAAPTNWRASWSRRRARKITCGTCYVMGHGMEHWHPNPDFFFQPGAGPVLDMGPYYVADLIKLSGR